MKLRSTFPKDSHHKRYCRLIPIVWGEYARNVFQDYPDQPSRTNQEQCPCYNSKKNISTSVFQRLFATLPRPWWTRWSCDQKVHRSLELFDWEPQQVSESLSKMQIYQSHAIVSTRRPHREEEVDSNNIPIYYMFVSLFMASFQMALLMATGYAPLGPPKGQLK